MIQKISAFFKGLFGIKIPLFLIPCLVLFLFIAYFVYMLIFPTFEKGGVKYTRDWLGRVVSAEKISGGTDLKTTKEGPLNPVKEVKFWEIVKTDTNPNFPTGLRIYEDKLDNPGVVRWKDFLIGYNTDYYPSGELGSGGFGGGGYEIKTEIRSVRVFDIKTGEVFDVSLNKPTWGDLWSVSNQTVSDVYYFGVGGAFGPSTFYRLNLPPTRNSTIIKLESKIGWIEKIGDNYLSSFCYEGCQYSLFHPDTEATTPLPRLTEASNDKVFARKEAFVGFDKTGRAILNIRNIPAKNDGNTKFETLEIVAMPLTDEKATTLVVDAKSLPEKIFDVQMIDGQSKILLLGSSKAYFYDISANTTSEVKNAKGDQLTNTGYPAKIGNALCFYNYDNRTNFSINSESGAYTANDNICSQAQPTKTVHDVFNNLKLPENYKLVGGQADYMDLTEWKSP